MRKKSSNSKMEMHVVLTINEVRCWDKKQLGRTLCCREDTYGLVKLKKACNLTLLLDAIEKTQVCKVELPRLQV